MTTSEILAASPTLRAAVTETVDFCVENRITDPAVMMEIMDRAVVRIQAEMVAFVARVRADTDEGRAIRRAILRQVWIDIRTEAGLPVD